MKTQSLLNIYTQRSIHKRHNKKENNNHMKSNMACKLLWRFSNVCAQCPFHYPHVPLVCMCVRALCTIQTRAIHCVQLRWQSSLSTVIGKWNELTPKQWNACVSHPLFIDQFFIITFVFIVIIHDANYLIINITLTTNRVRWLSSSSVCRTRMYYLAITPEMDIR